MSRRIAGVNRMIDAISRSTHRLRASPMRYFARPARLKTKLSNAAQIPIFLLRGIAKHHCNPLKHHENTCDVATRKKGLAKKAKPLFSLVTPAGFEPATFSLEGRQEIVSTQRELRLLARPKLPKSSRMSQPGQGYPSGYVRPMSAPLAAAK